MRYIVLLFFMFCSFFSYGQNPSVTIQEVEVRHRMDPEDGPPPSVNSQEYHQRKITAQIIITFSGDINSLQEVIILNGTGEGKSEYLTSKLSIVQSGGKNFLSNGNTNWEIKGNKIVIEQEVSERSLDNSNYFTIGIKDKKGQLGKNYIKKIK